MIGSVGPKVSSVMHFIVWSTSTSTVGSKKRPAPGACVAAGEHARALLHGVGDVVLDRVELRREGDRADLDRAGAFGLADAQRANFLGDFRDELVVDGLLDVDALDRDARLPGVLHRVVGREVGGALEVGVGEHDHRVLAAELQRGGDQPPGGGFGDLACRCASSR